MRILVTGGAGFIGSHVVLRLLERGQAVRVIDNLSTGREQNLADVAGDVELIKGDICDLAEVEAAADGCDAIIHLAAVPSVPRSVADPFGSHEANATGTLNVLLAARAAGASRVVAASSSSVYGASPKLPKQEDDRPLPLSPYGVSKLAAESYCRSFHEVYGLEAVALRYFNVFGPRQDPKSEYAAVIPKFIWAYRNGEPPVIFGDGEQSRDFTYVDNVVDANMAALEVPGIGGGIYNIACGQEITLNTLALKLRRALKASIEPIHGPERPGEVRKSVADISLAKRDLAYEPRTSLDQGLVRTIAHFDAARALAERPQHAIRRVRSGHVPGTNRKVRSKWSPRAAPRQTQYLITGGAGFIGSHLAERLSASKARTKIVVLDDLSLGRLENIQHLIDDERIEFVEGSVTDAALVDELMRPADVCVHLASAVGVQLIVNEPLDTLMRSIRGSNVVMHAAQRHHSRVLFSSTSEVYGKQTNGALNEQSDLIFGSPAKGRWTYAIAKTFGEALAHGYHRQRGVDTVVVRLFNTVGPRQTGMYGMVLPRFVSQALRGEDLTVFGTGAQTRCFTHVRDTVAALDLLCHSQEAVGNTFNIGGSSSVAIVELARRVIERASSVSSIVLVPYDEAYGEGFEELGRRRPDTTALMNATGWQPLCNIDDAIDDVIAYERARIDREDQSARLVGAGVA